MPLSDDPAVATRMVEPHRKLPEGADVQFARSAAAERLRDDGLDVEQTSAMRACAMVMAATMPIDQAKRHSTR